MFHRKSHKDLVKAIQENQLIDIDDNLDLLDKLKTAHDSFNAWPTSGRTFYLKLIDSVCKTFVDAGWFESWPKEAIDQAQSHFETFESDGAFLELSNTHPGLRMTSVFGDVECIDEENSYTTLLNDFANGSHGLLSITSINEKWWEEDGEIESVTLSCKVNGVDFKKSLEYQGDWISEDFFELLEQILANLHPDIVLYCPDELYGQDYGYMYINTASA